MNGYARAALGQSDVQPAGSVLTRGDLNTTVGYTGVWRRTNKITDMNRRTGDRNVSDLFCDPATLLRGRKRKNICIFIHICM